MKKNRFYTVSLALWGFHSKLYPLSIALIFSLFFSQNASAQTYCVSKSNAPWEDWIGLVQINTLTNISGKTRDDRYVVGYSDFTDKVAVVQRGNTDAYPLSVDLFANWPGRVANKFLRVWIDYNGDGDFTDADEQIFESNITLNGTQATGRLLFVPATARLGTTRARVAFKLDAYPTPCETFAKGEVEDYTVQITEGPTSAGKDTLKILSATPVRSNVAIGDTISVVATIINVGNAPNALNKTLMLSDIGTITGRRTSQYFLTSISDQVPVGVVIAPQSTRTVVLKFRLNTNFTHKQPLREPNTPLPIGQHLGLSNYPSGNTFVTAPDTVPFKLGTQMTVNLPRTDLSIVATPSQVNYSGNQINYSLRVRNNATTPTNDVDVVAFSLPFFHTAATLTPSKGATQLYNVSDNVGFQNISAGYWYVGPLAAGEEATCQVQVAATQFELDNFQFNIPYSIDSRFFNDNVPANNSGNVTIQRSVANLPDLTLTNLAIPTPSVQRGQVLNWKVDIRNIGTAAATGNFTVKAYISTDNVLDANDIQDGTIPTGNYAAGLVQTQVAGASRVPPTFSAGNYYLILKVDADNQITESNENNNVIVSASTFFVVATDVSLPDLAVENFNLLPPLSVQPGQTLNWTVDVKNVGLVNVTRPFTVKAYVDTRTLLINDGTVFTINSFAAGATRTITGTTVVPSFIAAGNYNLQVVADADRQITESSETNNTLQSTTTFTVTTGQTGNYCAAKATAPWELWISEVSLNNFYNTSTQFKDFNTLGYSDYTNLSINVVKGTAYPFTIKPGLSWIGNLISVYCRVWVDYNNNKIFEDAEKVTEGVSANPFFTSFTAPTTVANGAYRMRVAMKWGSYPTPCETFDRGEVEDYTINIQSSGNNCILTNCPADVTVTTSGTTASVTWSIPTLSGTCGGIVASATAFPYTTRIESGASFPIGTTRVRYELYNTSDGRLIDSSCHFNVTVTRQTTNNDLSLIVIPPTTTYRPYQTINYQIQLTNTGNQDFTNIKVQFPFPNQTVAGGGAVARLGTWNEWCLGGRQCFEWTIPRLNAGTSGVLEVPIFVLNATSTLTATAKILASTPTDANVANNTVSYTLIPAAPTIQGLARQQPTQLIPVVIQSIKPTITEGDVVIELESLIEREVRFDIANSTGQTVFSEKRKVGKGRNQLEFNVFELPQGMYFIQTDVGKGRGVPTKFLKM